MSGELVQTFDSLPPELDPANTRELAAEASKALAYTKARISLAQMVPRDWDKFRQRATTHARRTVTAAAALYHRPVGRERNPVTGNWEEKIAVDFTVGFVHTLLQEWRHVDVVRDITWINEEYVKVEGGVWDLASNNRFTQAMLVPRTVERRDPGDREVRSERLNSKEQRVYSVYATPAELRSSIGAELSKLVRDNGKRCLPHEILLELRAIVEATIKQEIVQDPDAARKRIFDSFAEIGITAEMLAQLVTITGRITEAHLADLRLVYNTLKEGTQTWAEIVAARQPKEPEPAPPKQTAKERVMSRKGDKADE